MIFTNKHVVVALIVSPILAILAWFAIGHYAGEKPAAAQVGKSYPLLEKSNCRYDSGRCELENEDFKLAIVLQGTDVVVESAHSLRGIMIAVGKAGVELAPISMVASDTEGKTWRFANETVPGVEDRIFLVASTPDNAYFGDASTQFVKRPAP